MTIRWLLWLLSSNEQHSLFQVLSVSLLPFLSLAQKFLFISLALLPHLNQISVTHCCTFLVATLFAFSCSDLLLLLEISYHVLRYPIERTLRMTSGQSQWVVETRSPTTLSNWALWTIMWGKWAYKWICTYLSLEIKQESHLVKDTEPEDKLNHICLPDPQRLWDNKHNFCSFCWCPHHTSVFATEHSSHNIVILRFSL